MREKCCPDSVPWQWIEKSGMKCIIYELTTGSQSCFVIEHVPCADICLATMEQRVSSKGFPCCLDILCDTGHHRTSSSTTSESSHECKSPRCSPGPGNTGFPCQAQGSESQELTTVPPGGERTSWLTLSLEAGVLLHLDGRRHLAVPQAS